jgi:hypothetical protein
MSNKDFKVKNGLQVPGLTTAGIVTTSSSGVISSSTTVSIENGGTGQTSATNAINALLPVQNGSTVNYSIQSDGTNVSWAKLYNQVIQNAGVSVNPRRVVNFIGAAFADNSETDTTTITLSPTPKYQTSEPSDPVLGQIWVDSDDDVTTFNPYIISRSKFTATDGQTTFSSTQNFIQGYEQVFLNGILLVYGDDYTTPDTSSIILASGASVGDSVEIFIQTNLSAYIVDTPLKASTFMLLGA